MKLLFPLALLSLLFIRTRAQTTFPVNGIPANFHGAYAYTHATIFVTYNRIVSNATMLVREGKVEAVGNDVKIPGDAVVTDLKGAYVYPAFIDLYSNYGMRQTKRSDEPYGEGGDVSASKPQFISNKRGAYNWNQAVKPETNASEQFVTDTVKANTLRAMGFGYTLTNSLDGIMRGTAALVNTGNERENKTVVMPEAAAFYSFQKGSSTQDYPSSLMGAIALLRQTFYDAQWYASGGSNEEQNMSLDALNGTSKLPRVFQSQDVQSDLRADKVANEFNFKFIIKGNGDEYQRINEIKNTNTAFVLPLTFPLPFDIGNTSDAAYLPLAQLKHWELAPFNARILYEHHVPFCFTSFGLDNASDFLKNLRVTVKDGLPKEEALKALTQTPATLLGNETVGSLERGRRAAFVVCTGDVFNDSTKIVSMHVNDRDYLVTATPLAQTVAPGHYNLSVNKSAPYDLVVDDNPGERKPYILMNDTTRVPVAFDYSQPFVTMEFDLPGKQPQHYTLTGVSDSTNIGGTTFVNGVKANWLATYNKPYTRKPSTIAKKSTDTIPKIPSVLFPFQAYGWDTLPKQEDVILKNATVWTNEQDGIQLGTDVWIRNGKIYKIGKNLSGAKTLDCTGKHVTAGIVDEHSHIAISQGVNEGTQSVTSEVRIADVVDATDVNIYRQLAGGVTSSHLLHGSANCIGGQTQLIKLRWGYAPDALKFAGWPGFIKFALGENVKQSNWGDNQTQRFPQTRMGVEQVMYDAFTRARNYKKSWSDYNAAMSGKRKKDKSVVLMPRRDLKLDALAEILDHKRFITCHSYVQSEIVMLMRVADSMHFTLNTFTHVLEGYKVADKLKAHGANASTFSDWWAYKMEVLDAIPYNGALLNAMGINTAFNSDDPEMARRLNQEAAKAVKYGGVSEEEAWKFVTLNPAKMLHVDDKVGSLKVGKDADVAVWSDNPLSIYARAERTYVDGICFYSAEQDLQKRAYIAAEKNRIATLMQKAKRNGSPTQSADSRQEFHYECETVGEFVK